ncbi:hypothetical protein EVG20_g8981 [Dentipellis fragilis]|uniref:Uncharacterized protein n=1 Tax=Dentipellis fragilis TaxID=205917 RepID=A0A4Y9Y4D7_9AGAM|nr:hypothetical protein EVG20_g8981 [Dentipellis fragilis]
MPARRVRSSRLTTPSVDERGKLSSRQASPANWFRGPVEPGPLGFGKPSALPDSEDSLDAGHIPVWYAHNMHERSPAMPVSSNTYSPYSKPSEKTYRLPPSPLPLKILLSDDSRDVVSEPPRHTLAELLLRVATTNAAAKQGGT